MKRSLIFAITLFVSYVSWSFALQLPASNDTIPSEVQEDPEPRIIYYQSTPDEAQDRGHTKSRTRRSGSRGNRGIKTLSGSMNHSGGFGALTFKSSNLRDEALVMAGLRGGWIINRTLALGAEGYGIIPTAKFDDIALDAEALALGGYGGLFMELIFFSNEVVHVTFPVGGGAGWLGYEITEETTFFPSGGTGRTTRTSLIDDDVFWYVEPGADIEINVARNFRLVFGVSKRFTQDLEIISTRSRALEDLNFFVTLKVGSF